MKLNETNVKKKLKDLTEFPGWLPVQFLFYINVGDRVDYIKKNGLKKKLEEENYIHRVNSKKSGDYYKYFDEKLVEWIKQNPYFKDCVEL